jgi:hypothetical protein
LNVIITSHDIIEFKSVTLRSVNKFYLKAGIIAFELLLFQVLFAQPEYMLLTPRQDTLRLMRYNLYDNLSKSSLFDAATTTLSVPFEFNYNNFQPNFNFGKDHSRSFSFSQSKTISEMPGLGSVEHFSNHVRWDAGSKTKIDFEAGLASQNTIMNLFVPNYQLSFKGSIEYAYNDWITAYLYGQYLTAPLNKPDDFFDPFIHNNPLFLQNEAGAGIYTTYKKSRIDLQIFSIYGSDFKDMRPVHSKLRIGF